MYRRDHWRKGITASDIGSLVNTEIDILASNLDGGRLEDLQEEIKAIKEVVCKLATLFPEEAVLKLFPEWGKQEV